MKTKELEKKNAQKFKAWEEAIKTINKRVKTQTKSKDTQIGFLNDMDVEVERFSSGSLILDSILGGGFPRGRVIEIYGPEASGKTSVALTAIANIQREGGFCAFIDAEQALDTRYSAKLGVDWSQLAFSQQNIAEDVLTLVHHLAETGVCDLIVVDSIASLSPRAEYEAEIGKQTIGLLARLLSQALRKLVRVANDNDCSIMFLNQTRDNIGIMYGPRKTTPGGNALKFYASQRVEVRRMSQVKEGEEIIGNEVKMKVVKNKVSRPYGEGVSVLTFNEGINQAAEIMVMGLELGVINQVGQTFYLPGEHEETFGYDQTEEGLKLAVYKKNLINELKINKPLAKEITKLVTSELARRNENADAAEE